MKLNLKRINSFIGRDPFNQNFRKFPSKTQWIGSVQPEKFRKNGSTLWGGPLFPVGPVGILVEWIAPIVSILVTSCENRHGTRTLTPAMQINKMSSMDRKSVCHQEMVDRLRDEHNGTDLGLADKGSFLTYVI